MASLNGSWGVGILDIPDLEAKNAAAISCRARFWTKDVVNAGDSKDERGMACFLAAV